MTQSGHAEGVWKMCTTGVEIKINGPVAQLTMTIWDGCCLADTSTMLKATGYPHNANSHRESDMMISKSSRSLSGT